ncbi:5'-nucleotidase [Legionella norrlandica]|uniref:5'-nucleotidase n=1 Tax=Legionella norrlandica TaxID=1498499 RepID=A0A0A2SSU7_9GAMM|nr:bifunctional metallophosphatase/5'-nucleotidase [Legionella norrlandica]KGP62791.1 5'-nucleotidase [Legionella norrlandica]
MLQWKNLYYYFKLFILSISLVNSPPNFASTEQPSPPSPTIALKILGINDFHGQISTGRMVNNEPAGGAAVLAAYLREAQSGMEDQTIITIMGDLVGASPPSSGLLNDEPTILFINSLANNQCTPENRMAPLCNIVATIGNHEFDKGQKAMFDLIYGTNNPPSDSWIPLLYYPGSSYPYISANIVDIKSEQPIFPPYTIKLIHNIPVAFIGAILKNAADSMFPANAEGIKFLDEAESINHYIPEIKAKGVDIIIVLIHEGGNQESYEGDTRINSNTIEGHIKDVVYNLSDEVDVVMGGHTHQFLNTYLPNRTGHNILVTQANSYSTAFAEVNLQLNVKSHKVENKSAKIITTYADRWPGTNPDAKALEIVKLAENKVEPIINTPVGTLQFDLLRKQNEDGESNLGNLVADAFKSVMHTDIGITNLNGIRDDLKSGEINWGNIYSILPFSNRIVAISLNGNDIYDLLEQQWMGSFVNILQVSGLSYTYDSNAPLGHKIIEITYQNKPLVREQTYTIATSDFLMNGNGIFSVIMKRGKITSIGKNDHDTVVEYIKNLPQPFHVSIEGRIKKRRSSSSPITI